jgi:hypothetical protein
MNISVLKYKNFIDAGLQLRLVWPMQLGSWGRAQVLPSESETAEQGFCHAAKRHCFPCRMHKTSFNDNTSTSVQASGLTLLLGWRLLPGWTLLLGRDVQC